MRSLIVIALLIAVRAHPVQASEEELGTYFPQREIQRSYLGFEDGEYEDGGSPVITKFGVDLAAFDSELINASASNPVLNLRGGISQVSKKAFAGVEVTVSW